MKPASNCKFIVVHYSATPVERNFSVIDINDMHIRRGWDGIGYHYYITKDGRVWTGRGVSSTGEFEVGAHVQGHNHHSVGICYEGGVTAADPNRGFDTRTPAQTAAMKALIRRLKGHYPGAVVCGHRQMPGAATQCPGFDAAAWWASVEAASKPLANWVRADSDEPKRPVPWWRRLFGAGWFQ